MPRTPLTIVFLIALSIVLAASGCSVTNQALVKITEKDKGSTITVNKNQALRLSLPSNPTTGYSWEIVSLGGPTLKQQAPSKFQQQGNGIGAGGVEIFTFKPTRAGKARITMIYHRKFEPKVPPTQTFEIQVKVID